MDNTIRLIPNHEEGRWNLYLIFELEKNATDLLEQLDKSKDFDVYLTDKGGDNLFIQVDLKETITTATFKAKMNTVQQPLVNKEVTINKFSTGYLKDGKEVYNQPLPTVVKYRVN